MSEPSTAIPPSTASPIRRLRSLLSAVGKRIFYRHRSIWYERPLDDTLQLIPPRFEGRIDFDSSEKVARWIDERNVPGTNDPAEISSMRERGHLFAGIYDREQLIGYVKIGWGTVYVLDYRIDLKLKDDDFFIIDAYVIPEKRGLGAGPFMVSASSLEMKRRGFRRRVSHVRSDNMAMIKSGRRAGYREIGRVDFLIIFGKKIFRPHPASFID